MVLLYFILHQKRSAMKSSDIAAIADMHDTSLGAVDSSLAIPERIGHCPRITFFSLLQLFDDQREPQL